MTNKIEGIRKLIADDQRSSERLKLPVKIFYSPATWYPVWTGPVTVDDIGGDGLKFTTGTKLDKDSKLKLKIVFPGPGAEPIVVTGHIVWSKDEGTRHSAGVKFYRMNALDRRRYVEYICDRILLKFL